MIGKAFLSEQIARLRTLPNTPQDMSEIVNALLDRAETEKRARQIVDIVLMHEEFALVPAHIHRAADQLAETERFDDNAPSPFDQPGEFNDDLFDLEHLCAERRARLQELAEHAKDHWRRDLAKAVLARAKGGAA